MNFIEACQKVRSWYRQLDFYHGYLQENINFLHIPKCGGTSITQAIRKYYHQGNCYSINHPASAKATIMTNHLDSVDPTDFCSLPIKLQWLHFEECLFLYFMNQKNTRFVSGHWKFSEEVYHRFSSEYRFITVLRDPVKRWISAYFFFRYDQKGIYKINCDVKTYLQSEVGKLQGSYYVFYLGGIASSSNYTSRKAIDNAKKNLDKFDLVGFLEHLDTFQKQFKQRFGVRLKVPTTNKNPKSPSFQASQITEEIREEIREVCKPDLEIYHYALDKFLKNA